MALAPVPMIATALSASLSILRMHVAARCTHSPSDPCGRTSHERLHALDVGKLDQVEDPYGHDEMTRTNHIAAVGVDDPAGAVFVPLGGLDAGVEQRASPNRSYLSAIRSRCWRISSPNAYFRVGT